MSEIASAIKHKLTIKRNRSGRTSPLSSGSTPSHSPTRNSRKSLADESINSRKSLAGSTTSSRKSLSDEHVGNMVLDSRNVERVGSISHSRSPSRRRSRFASGAQEIMSKLHLTDGNKSNNSSEHDLPFNRSGEEMSKNQLRKHEKQVIEEQKKEKKENLEQELQKKKEEAKEAALREDTPEQRARYGERPINNYAREYREAPRTNILDLKDEHIGQEVLFRARIHNIRKLSSKLSFYVLRQQYTTIQGVLQESEYVSKHMIYWAEHIPVESIVMIKGVVQIPKAKEGEVIGAYIHDKEILIQEFHLISKVTEHLPFTVNEAEVTEAQAKEEGSTRHHVGDRARMNGRILDLRTTTSNAIFKLQAAIGRGFRQYLDSQGFMEIHTPKLQGAATESGASVFKVEYFGRTAFLAQSPQLAKQMSVAADFRRVYEIGPVFRAENSNTHRHLTEYTGLDIEMAIDEHYHEARNLIDNTIKAIFETVYKNNKTEIEIVKNQFPHEDLVWLDETLILPFKEAIQILNDSGWKGENGQPLPLDEDLGTRDEIQLGRVIKEKFKTDYYILDKFPTSARPFYTMPDPDDPAYSNSFDVFVRGQEIISGGQRIHDAAMLAENMEKVKIDPKAMEEYMQAFEWGAPPHAGAGVGLERLTMLLFQLGDIRHASMYPRDPKSLPAKPVIKQLRHPEASTLHPPWGGKDRALAHIDLQPLEKLIANYGDASNTSWLETRTVIWRDAATGAAMGYVPHQGFAITVGDPLCHTSQYTKIIASYLDFIKKETDLKPLWLLCGHDVEDVLSSKLDWRTFSCAAEQRLDLRQPLKASKDSDIQRKIRHAEKEGIKIHSIPLGTKVPNDVIRQCDERINDWLGARKSHQHVHLTDVHPWQDMDHRQYYYATESKNGNRISALLVMAQLSPDHGWQVKFSLDFPGSINGTIEALNVHALTSLKNGGATDVTFGGAATADFVSGANLKGTKVKMLTKAYHTIAHELKLTQKTEFREKLGAEEDRIWIAYPPKGLGPKGVHAILSFFED